MQQKEREVETFRQIGFTNRKVSRVGRAGFEKELQILELGATKGLEIEGILEGSSLFF